MLVNRTVKTGEDKSGGLESGIIGKPATGTIPSALG